ncbi:tRNA (N(6)-L-threonylcarbamoyladenosine(37)-C(2))-methylthiotransferase MtaB [Sulfurospirillum sp. hDNRA2]|uniref:tRNA (N(6)-L-threonylcarbamoyladenosine(37)-C(2))- methylthiotransferase MtaB n=1 Tax=Sulfurospirillum sp. hDNRA2 TaxID=3237298 RepID=UPI0020B8DC3C|nr:tRNA (N(6)-L-threonylcarbamoyladenosine(37)-C(2))-methylthiotransferase MtaB [Sulfurospirillum sp. DNRA8]MCP3651131.1 tRNA (N(6)-L-threonylcarbamoyladenosine(37)-C(2))-methylthiotransferase MtaB [Sulfurospirillum sp. DNRA8]MCR1809977.1 tRNA (N(6)-L-threonylcarbamoyladenosine(37)-C(2))-methylthiotransferase MtaB [Sulfurospirillum sp. DNRA8]
MKKVYFKTFGCRTNIYDTQVMMENLHDFELTEDEHAADIVVVNSCTVTNGADSGVRSYINHVSKEGKKVIVAGCGAMSKGESLFAQKKVFGVMGHSEKAHINTLLKYDRPFFEIGDLTSLDETIVHEYTGKTKAFIKIQEGCNFRCAYCIIPFVRGNARSQDENTIVEQVRKLALNGYGEFVLTGTNIGSYGKDKGSSLGKLVQRLGAIRGVRRIRLGSIEPIQIDESFREILREPWLERHLHIALQHTSETMLELMRRRNRVMHDLELFCELSEQGFALGTDFITGHPGESDAIWQEAYRTLEKFPLTHLHAFTYSKRDGTPSALMKPEIKGDIAKERLKQIEALVHAKNIAFRQARRHVALDVLVEEYKDGLFIGYDQFFNKVTLQSERDVLKEWVNVTSYEILGECNHANF